MLKFYIGTVLIYALIILATANLCAQNIKDNGWLDNTKPSSGNKLTLLFCVAIIPIVRLGTVIMMIYMFANKKPDDWPTK